ncbi:cytochrome c family protein [Desulfovibrio sp. OttesenSCG-928-M14]|nr:cytochrome c family protein [Desulfovibrio sp. OttesenSCG-928-M14]MDL2291495.1 cytochrome c family protein [Desulfovibrio sp. OttesenSCG-928-F20]
MKKDAPAATLGFARCLCLAFVLVLGAGFAAFAQDDMTHIKSPAFAEHTRPAAVFVHDAHNEKAGIEDCAACHHGKNAEGKQDKEDMSAGTPCADCHAVNAEKGTPLMRAYHQQCISCHEKQAKGPTHCAGCHVKS